MVRLLSDFFAPERVEGNKVDLGVKRTKKGASQRGSLILLGVWIALKGMTSLGWSAEPTHLLSVPTVSPSAPPLYEVERLNHLNPSEKIRVGDRLELRLRGFVPRVFGSGAQGSPGELKMELLDPHVTLQESGWEWIEKSGSLSGVSDEFHFWMVPVRPGQLVLPSFLVKDSSGKELARSASLQVEVVSAISAQDPEPDQPNDLEPPVGLKFPVFWTVVLGVAGALFLGGVFTFLWCWWKKRKESSVSNQKVVLPEDQIALNRLKELSNMDYLALGEYKKHYFGISEILKSYVGSRYRVDALEATTREMVNSLTALTQIDSPFSGEVSESRIAEIKKLFVLLDRVKFTDFKPEAAEAEEVIREAQKWVEVTRRRTEPIISESSPILKEQVENAVR